MVRALIDRLAAMTLMALLAGPSVAPCRSDVPDERDRSSARDTGMSSPPGPTASPALSVVPAALAAPLSVTPRVVVAFYPLDFVRPIDRAPRLVPAV